MHRTEQVLLAARVKQDECQEMRADFTQVGRQIDIVIDQNKELEREVDFFMKSDNEIRSKLHDRNASPVKLHELYKGAIAESKKVCEEMSRINSSRGNLIELRPCSQERVVEIVNHAPFMPIPSHLPPRGTSPLR